MIIELGLPALHSLYMPSLNPHLLIVGSGMLRLYTGNKRVLELKTQSVNRHWKLCAFE